MATYMECAGSPVTVLSSADKTGINTGNLTAAFTVNVLGTMPPIWEWYRGVVDTQDPTKSITPALCPIRLNLRRPVSVTFPAGASVFAPPNPPIFRSGDELFFFWQLASGSTPVPQVTLSLRFDTTLPANQSFIRGFG